MPAPEYAIKSIEYDLPDFLEPWHTSDKPPLTITYSFEDNSTQFGGGWGNYTPFTDEEKAILRGYFQEFETAVNLVFKEVPAGTPDVQIAFGQVDNLGAAGRGFYSYKYSTDATGAVTSKAWDSWVLFATDTTIENTGFRHLFVHETMHALGYKHAGAYDSGGSPPPGPYLPPAEDNVDYTIMSYNWSQYGSSGMQLQLYDIAAMQARFGANTTYARGDDVYTLDQDWGIWSIWDTGGYDTIDATWETSPVTIDLRDGGFSKEGLVPSLSIAYGVQIEAAKGTVNADTLTGNALDNQLTGGGGNDRLDGGAGRDMAVFGGSRADYAWAQGSDLSWTVTDQRSSGDGVDTLFSIEVLKFADGAVDLVAPPPPPPDDGSGKVINSLGPGSTLTGGQGNDTLNASQGSDTLTGGPGSDVFAWAKEPWSPATVTDFALGSDRLDLSRLFQAAGYTGADPVADKYVTLTTRGADTLVLFDRDGAASGQQWPNFLITLQNVTTASWAQLAGGPGDPPDDDPPPPDDEGQVIDSPGPGSTLTGGSGNDTLNASQGSDVLTGGGGADVFAWAKEPWSPATVKDFALGADRLDLSKLFQAAGYSGSDPVADGRVILLGQGSDTLVLFDDDGPGGDWGNYIIKLEGVSSAGLTWAELSGGGEPPPPPPPDDQEGRVINSAGPGSTLQGGDGADTLNASRGSDVLTGAGGADRFVFAAENWSPAQITDFEHGIDKIDIRGMLDAVGYLGADPFADGYLRLLEDGAGGTKVLFDRDVAGPDPQWPNYIIHIEGVAPGRVSAGDWLFQ